MECILNELQESQPWLEYGKVVGYKDESIIVSLSNGYIQAERAISCVVRPEKDDTVLISMDAEGRCFILSVLVRAQESQKTDLIFSGDVTIRAEQGRMNLLADRDITIGSDENLSLASGQFSLHARKGRVAVDKISVLSRVFQANIKGVKVVFASMEQIIGRLTQKLRNSFRFIKEHHEVQAGSARYLVDDMLSMHSKNALHMAEEIVTINGEQVHLG